MTNVINSGDDRLKTVYPALALGLLTTAIIIAKTGRDALFFILLVGLMFPAVATIIPSPRVVSNVTATNAPKVIRSPYAKWTIRRIP